MKRILYTALALAVISTAALAEDGQLFRKNVSKTPELETNHATMKMLKLYVPAQTSDGTLGVPIEYYDKEGTLVETRDQAKPLVAFYHDGEVEHVPDVGFPGHGKRDVYGAYSLDDGATWKRKNLSNSGDLSSFTLRDGTTYYGDTFRLFAAAAGNKVVVAWASRYCRGGNANYAMDDTQREDLAAYLGFDAGLCTDDTFDRDCLFLEDGFGVTGSQGSSDFADEGYPEVGEVPYACLWTARGTLEPVNVDGAYDESGDYQAILWRKAERLTSGKRDVHRIEVQGVPGAGFVMTWQEDPDGLRPGKGEGPGEGWSGAIGHHQTDIWYSYIDWQDFDAVDDGDGLYGVPITLAEFYATVSGIPQVGVPFAMPVRLTDNAMCVGGDLDNPYCYADFDSSGVADLCASTVTVNIETPEGPTQDLDLCITEDGRLLRGNIASTRARTNLRAYEPGIDRDGDGEADKSAWVVLAYEESKGLGEEDDEEIDKIDMGKNIWYHTFEMFNPELVSQGLMLNQPAVYPDDFAPPGGSRLVPDGSLGYNFMDIEPDPIYEEQAGIDVTLYQAEIARRFSMISQPADNVGPSETVAFAMWKQGIIRQGGPADVYARRFVLPETFDPAVDNPFDYANMDCTNGDDSAGWAFTDGANPRYVKGLCAATAINMSGTTIVDCDDGSGGVDCADAFPWNDYFDDLDMSDSDGLAKMTTWMQEDPALATDGFGNFNDLTWENPYEVAKGHRGFIDGDFVMMMYAWSPNWMANTVGHDNYNLYARRSFDGGVTWTTLPTDWSVEVPEGVTITADGTETCEIYRSVDQGGDDPVVCTFYAAGEFEQARNLSLLVGTRLTVLDPRFSPTSASIGEDGDGDGVIEVGETVYDDDLKDPSKFFATFETGDNTTVEFGEAEPLDMFYSRAFNWGDDYEMVLLEDPDPPELPYYFDWLEGSQRSHASEAAVMANPGGTFFYAIWNQEDVDRRGRPAGSDGWMRRLMFLDEGVDDDGSGGGGGGGGGGGNR